LLNDGKFD